MALRDQPYLPLYVQDFLTDEKLSECSAESTGVYIRLMCLMHKSEEYGTILLKQKDKQTGKQISDFAIKLARQMPFDTDTIERALSELLEEKVISIEGDVLYQKRMVRDGKLSDTRASAGSKGGKKRASQDFASPFANGFALDFAQAKTQANAESESEYENEHEYEKENEGDIENENGLTRAGANGMQARFDEFWSAYPKKVGKGAAQKAWAKIRPSATLHKKMMAAIADAIESEQWQRDDGRYIPNPSTWLNQSRWEDELKKKGGEINAVNRGHTGGGFRPSTGFRRAEDEYDG